VSLLRVDGIAKAYDDYRSEWRRLAAAFGLGGEPDARHWVLRDIDFELQAGESVGIVGPNGAGKSTLLKIITGTVQPSRGSVRFDGACRVAAILELGLGFLPEFTGRENARHTAELMGIGPAEIDAALPGIEAFADIGDYFDAPVRTYSTGMQTRVAFATATAFRPDLLIVDEALSVGDAYFQAKCFERIAAYRRDGMALMLVTHAVSDITTHCDRALLLEGGRLRADGPPAAITNLYFDTLFGQGPAASEVRDDTPAATPTGGENFWAGAEERFASRPGYRKEEHRWGKGGATILDFHVSAMGQSYPAEIDSGVVVEFAFKVRFDSTAGPIVPGILLKTIEGHILFGSNSYVAAGGTGQPISAVNGEVRIFTFRMPLSLNEGSYLLSFGVSLGDPAVALEPMERRYDAVIFQVRRRVPLWGLVDLGAHFEESALEVS
jgi:lipopolysaccharide transport system ATP-binding protein